MQIHAIRRQPSFFARLPIFGLSLCGLMPGVAPLAAQTLPSGGRVVVGQAEMDRSGSALTVHQGSDKAIIDWNDFSIGKGASVRFENGSGATLNRVTGTNASSIDGVLGATGSVYLINGNGIVFGREGRVDVGGSFVASTQNLTNEQFLAGGSLTLSGASEAAIVNYGRIGAAGGDVALVAAKVVNEGTLAAANGSVGLLAGYQVLLRDRALENGKFSVVVGGSGTSATNIGAIRAAEAELRAQGGNVYALAGNSGGIVNAQGVAARDGRIFLTAEGGEAHLTGTLRARTAEGAGGTVEVTAKNVLLGDKALVDASGTTGGTVLIGGDWQGGADRSLAVADHAVAHADAVVMADSARIDVSGHTGTGGTAVLWSDAYTNFLGRIDAQGATRGGRVETSSKGNLQALGSVNATGLLGAGQWLLDPSDITISSAVTTGGNFAGTAPLTFTPSGTSSVANVTTINNALNAGTNVLIATGSSGGGNGDITLASGTTISKSSGSTDATLQLSAFRNIVLNGVVNASGTGVGKLNLELTSRSSDTTNAAQGSVALNGAITLNGGNLRVAGGANKDGPAINASGAGVAIGGVTIDAGGGNIVIAGRTTGANAGISLASGGAITTSGTGSVSLAGEATASSGTTYGLQFVSGAGAITAGSGGLTLDGKASSSSGTAISSASTAAITSTGAIAVTGNKAISFAGKLTAGGAGGLGVSTTAGNVSLAALSSGGALTVTSPGSLSFGTVEQIGTGAMTFSSVSALTIGSAITKSGGSDSTLTLKSNSDVTVSGAITASAGKLNVYLNSRAADGATGAIAINKSITTLGGDIAAWGGSTAPDLANLAAAGTARGTGNTHGILISGSGTTLDAGGGNIGLAGEQTNSGSGNAGTGAVRIDSGTIVKTSGSGMIGVTGVGNANYGVVINSTLSTTDGAINIGGSSAGAAFAGVGVLLADKASVSTGTGKITMKGSATGADTGLMLNSGVPISITSVSGNISLTGTASGSNAVEGFAVISTGGHTISTGGAIDITASGGTTAFGSDRPKSAILLGRVGDNSKLTLSAGGSLSIKATAASGANALSGYLTSDSVISAGGALSINGGTDANRAIAFNNNNGTITAGGTTTIATASGNLTLPNFVSNGGTVSIKSAGNGLTIGNVTLATSGNVDLAAAALTIGTITKKAAAINASTLTIKSDGDININNAITTETGAGKFNVNLNSRANDAASGSIYVDAAIKTGGGDINLYGGSDTGKTGSAISLTGRGISLDTDGILDAGGGNILMRGSADNDATNGIAIQGNVSTNGQGGITAVGSTTNSNTGLIIGNAAINAGDGGINFTGTSTNAQGSSKDGSGIRINGSNATTITTTGDLTFKGTSTKFVGVLIDTDSTGSKLKGRNVTLTGTSLGGSDSTAGIFFKNTNIVEVTAGNKLAMTGTGGATSGPTVNNAAAGYRAAIELGAAVAMNAGSGGVVLDGLGADPVATYSIDTNVVSNNSVSINSAGSVVMSGNRFIYYGGTVTQTGGGASSISTQNGLFFNSYSGSNADNLTLSADAGSLETAGVISVTKDLVVNSGQSTVDADGAITVGGALTITAKNAVTTAAISQTGTSGAVTITSTRLGVVTGAIDTRTSDATTITASSGITTGAITLNGNSNTTLDAGAALTPAAITKKASATGASTLTLKSKAGITLANAINTESGAGKLDVTLSSRSAGATTGAIAVNANITTRGGKIVIGAGTDGSGEATGSGADGIAVAANIVLDARSSGTDGGAILMTGKAASGAFAGIDLGSGTSLLTNGTAAISLTGTSAGTLRGIDVNGTKIQTGTGTVTLTGTGNSQAGIGFLSGVSSVQTGGALTLKGTSSTGIGIFKKGSDALSLTAKDILLDGQSTGGTSSAQGILLDGIGTITIDGTGDATAKDGSVTMKGIGGATAGSGNDSSKSAIAFGSATNNTPLAVKAGSGGIRVDATMSDGGAWGMDNYSPPDRTNKMTFDSIGAVNVTSNGSLGLYGKWTQTDASKASVIKSDTYIGLGRTATASASFAGSLTVTAPQEIALAALTMGTGELKVTSNGVGQDKGSITADAITTSGAVTLTAARIITSSTITQQAATNTGALTLASGGTISMGAVNWATGDIALTSVADLTPGAITKLANAAGTSTLTVKSDGNITLSNAILADSGAGPLNVVLNSRAHDAASGTVAVSGGITTRGGDITLRGGSATAAAVMPNPGVSLAGFVTELTNTGTAISLSSGSLLNAGGGSIELRGTSTTTGLNLTSGTLATTGSGAINLYGLSTATGSGAGSGVNITGANVSTVNGALTVLGATKQSATADAVHIENASVTSTKGNVLISGANDSAASGSGNLAGVMLKSATVGITGSGATGTVTVAGQGGGGTAGSAGVYVSASSIASTSSGATQITGIGGGGSGTSNYGIYLDQGSATPALVNTTGSGAVTLDGRVSGGTSFGIYQGPNNAAKIGGGGSGALTLIANKMALANGSGSPALLNTTGALTLRPQTGGAFVVDGNILPALIANNAYRANYGSVTFGATDAGSLTFNTTATANSYASPFTLASGSGGIAIAGTDPLTASGGLKLNTTGAVTQAIDVNTGALSGNAGSIALTRATNNITGLGALTVTNDLSLATKDVLAVNGAVSTGTGLIRAAGDLTLASGGSVKATGSGTPLQLVTGTKVTNNAGSSALLAPNGRWLLWSNKPADDRLGGLVAAFRQYGAAFGASTPALATGNGAMYTLAPTLSVQLTGTYSRDYDGTTNAALSQSNFTVTGLGGSEQATVYSTASFDTKDVGTGKTVLADDLAVVVRDSGVKVFGYTLSTFSASGAIGKITPKTLTAGLTGNVSKVYDAGTSAIMDPANYTLSGVIGSETVDLVKPTSGTFADKNAGTNKLVTVSGLSLTGADAGNYIVAANVSGNIGTITPKALTAALTGAVSKTYDGTTVAALNSDAVALSGVLGGDVVTVANGLIGAYANKNTGTGKSVSVTAVALAGTDAGNYTVGSNVSGNIGTITARALTLSAIADTRTYDGTTASTGLVRATGLVGTDSVTASQAFDSKNAGSRTLQVVDGYTIDDGNGGANYVVSKGAAVTGTITPRLVTTTLLANDKVYDDTTVATGSFGALTNKIAGDDLSIDASQATFAFFDRHAGNGKAVTSAGYKLAGADAGNYTLAAIGNGVAKISKATLTLTAATDSKTYDGKTSSSGVVTSSGLLGNDTVTATQTFSNKAAGNRTLQVTKWTVADGNNGNNYVVVTHDAAGTIGRKTISGQLTNPISKVYDGTTAAVLSGASLQGVIGTDAVTVSSNSAAYADKNTGINKLVTVTGMVLGGADSDNYVLQSTDASGNVGMITARAVNATTTGAGAKTYDRTTTLTHGQIGTLALTAADADTQALMQADGVTFDASGLHGTLADRNAGTGKVATLTGFALANDTANNYVLAGTTAQGVVDVARKALTLNAATDSKTYDGTAASAAIVQSAGLIAGDSVTATQAFDSKDAGDRTLSVTGYTVSDGNGGANYVVTANTALGAIAKRVVSTVVTADNKVYDGTVAATGTFGALQNVVAGDSLGATGTLTFANRNVGTGKVVTVSNATLTGTDARNYTLSPVADGTASITQAQLVLTAGADSKTYDGTTTSAGTVVATGLAAGDHFTATQHFDTKDAGVRLLTVDSGYAIDDGNGGANYIVSLAGTAGRIDKRVVATAVTVDTREYDGTTAATGTFGALQNVVSGETVTVSGGTLAFANRNVGTAKAVTVTGATLGGADAANYVLSDVANGTGEITAKELRLTAVADTKTYDGTLASGGAVQVEGLVAGDAVIANQIFDTKNTGRRWLQVDRYAVSDGNGGNNYNVVLGSGVLGTIEARVINAAVTVNDKVYDGTTTASGTFTGLTGVVAGDVVTVDTSSGVLAFLDRNAGNGKAVTVTGASLGGADAGNYALGSVGSGTANITKRALTLTATDAAKTYDGTRASTGAVTITGLASGDTATATQAFDSKNAGARTLSADSWTIADGNGGGNYTIVKVDAASSIGQKTISSNLTGTVSKVYDGTTAATILPANLAGVVAGDAITVSATSAEYDDRNAGTNKLVTVRGMTLNGADALNYVLDQDHSSANVGTITARQVAVTTSGRGSKTYDGTVALGAAQLGSLAFLMADGDAATTALLQSDNISLDLSGAGGTFADRHVGTGKGVTLGGYALSNNALGNYVLANSSVQGLADIGKATLTLTAATDAKTYDGNRTSTGTVTITGLVAGDTATATQAFDSKNAGSRALQVNGWTLDDGNDGGNYTIVKVDALGSIAQKTISSNLTGTVSKVYDGTTAATILPTNLSGVVAGDAVTIAAAHADYADRNVGTNKLVTVSGMTLNGTDAANYLLDSDSASANVGTITARQVAITASGRGAKTYDGTTSLAAPHLGTLTFTLADGDAVTQALLQSDGVALDASGVGGTLADRNAGTGKSAALTGFALANNGIGNYVLATAPVQGVVDVARQILTLTAATDTKVYDGTTASTGSVSSTGLVAGDTLSAVQAFDTKNAGGRTLQVTRWTIGDGNDGGNYTVVKVDAAGTIGRRAVSSSVSANDKVYDGTTVATGTFGAIANQVAGDLLSVTADLAFADRHAGVGKTVTVTNARLEGADAGNYTLDPIAVTNTQATINRANLVLTAGFDRKTYDGTTTSTGTVGYAGLVAGDTVTATQAFDAKTAGARTLQVTGWTIDDGNGGNNYLVSRGTATAGIIDRKALTADFTVDGKVYDGTTAATGTFTGFTGLVSGDLVAVDGSAATLAFADRNAGANKTVYATGIALTGTDAQNYLVAPLAAGTGTISAKALTLTAVADTKTYDGTTASAGRVLATGLVTGDGVVATQSFAGRTAGAHELQVDAGWRVQDGNGGGNYVVSLDQPAQGMIGKRTIGAAVTVADKIYDGTTTATGTVDGLVGLIAGDVVTVDAGQAVIAFADRNAGTGKTVTATGATLAGQDAGNYTLGTIASGTANIDRATLTLTAATDSRTYDGTTASAGVVTASGLVGGDKIDAMTQAFDTKNAGTRTLRVQDGYAIHDGNDGGNYRVVKVDAGGTIGRKSLSGALTGTVSKVYDGTTNAVLAGANLTGVAAGDRVDVAAASAAYADKNAGTGKLVTVTGMTLSGVDADNYVLDQDHASAQVGEVTARRVLLSTTGTGAKTYDGTVALTHAGLGSLAAQAADADTRALMAADNVTFDDAGVGGVMADRNAGTAKVVTLSGYALSGDAFGNYVLDSGVAQGVADVARKALELRAATDGKVYDGTHASSAQVTADGLVAGDGFAATQRFDGKDAGSRTLVVQDWTVSDGNAGGNYLVTTVNAAGNIARRVVTTQVQADDRVYDGTTAATGTFGALTNVVAGETLGITGTLTFANRNAGVNKVVTVTGATLTGSDARNYELSPVADGTATITRAALVLTAGDDRKVYDGTLASSGTVRATGLMAGDGFTATQAFDAKDAGARVLTVENGWQVQDNNSGDNYTVSLANGAGLIDRRTLTTGVTVDTKEYDGTLAATGTFGTLQNVVAGETVTLSGGTLAFADRNAGTGKAVTVTGATLSGADAANYVLADVAAGTGTVTRKALLLTAGQDSKVYDGTLVSSGQVQASGLVAGDAVIATQLFDGKDVGTRGLQVATWSIGDGNGGNNYTVSIGDPVSGTITARALRAAAVVDDKTYDGTTTAVGRLTGLTGVLGNDDVTVGGSGLFTFVDRNAGAGKAVTVTGLTLGGAQAGNYVLDTVASGSATIAKALLTLTARDDRKTYDGTRASTGLVGITGLVGGDTATAVQAFDTKNAGGRILSADSWTIADGNGGGNYAIVKVDAQGVIDRKVIDGTLTGTVSKVYDGTDVATLLGTNLAGVIAGDAVDVHTTAAHYTGKDVGTGKLVTVTGMSLAGRDAANYDLTRDSASANVGTITARTVTVASSGRGAKTYDGNDGLAAAQRGSLTLTAAGDDAVTQALLAADGVALDTSGVTGTLVDRNAGTGKSVTLTGYTLTGNSLGNFVLASDSVLGVADVARAALVLTASDDAKIYDGTTHSTGQVTINGLVGGDHATATQVFDGRNAGDRVMKVVGQVIDDGNDGGNYIVRLVDAAGTIARRHVTTSAIVDDKVYDGTTATTGRYAALGNVVAGDAVAATGGTMAFADRHVGTAKTVTVSGTTLTGGDATNYELDAVADTTASISRATLILNAGTDTRAYDGTTLSTGAIRAVGLAAGDSVTATQAFDGKNAGARVLHVVDGSWTVADGNGGGNYVVQIGDTAAGAITQRVLTTATTVDTKEYDGTTAATGSFGGLFNLVGNDQVALSGGTLAFADRNAGTGKAVTVTGATLSGADAANYVLADVAAGTGTVTRKALLLTAGQDSKVYDGTLASSGQVQASGLVAGDAVIATQLFDDKDVGTRGLQVATWSIGDGNGGGNYAVSIGDPVSGTITARALRAAAVVDDKTYDGTTTAVGRLTGLTGVLGNDDVTVGGSGLFTFVDRNAGAGKAVTVTGLTLGGAQAGNYVLDTVAGGSATIAKALLTLTASDDRKTYDGTRASAGLVGITGLVGGDTATAVQAFDTKNAGGRILSADSWTIADGNGGGNYAIVKVDAQGLIDRKVIDGTLTGTVSKVYDGTDVATLLGTNLAGVIAGDAVDVHTTAAHYTGKDVGTGKLVTVTGMSLAGRDAANYDLTRDSASADVGTITARTVTVSVAGRGTKTYDGSDVLGVGQRGSLMLTAADGDAATQALMAADGVTFDTGGVTGVLADRNAGTGKSVTLGGYTLTGNSFGNYVLGSSTILGVADVARAVLELTAAGDAKTYDGTATSTGVVTISGLVGGDRATATQAFDGRNAGDRLLKVTGYTLDDGNDGGNYIVRSVDAAGTIARRLVTTSVSADNKVYDGTTAATGRYAALGNVLAGDAVAIGAGTMAFADRNAGSGKTVTVTGTTLTGGDAGNYLLDTIADTHADIAKATLTLNAGTDTRAYDGTTVSTGTIRAVGLAAGNGVTATQAFDGQNAGAHVLHVVDGSWTVADGNGGGNYIVQVGDTAAGAITQRVLTTAVTVDDKDYDGTTAATGSFGGLFNLVGNDRVSLSGGTLAFVDRNAGAAKAVTVTGATLTGADAANYVLADVASGTATIRRRALTLQAVADSRVYDGTTASAGRVLATGLVGGDTVDAVQRFDGRHAGDHLLQVADGWGLADGNGGGNYIVTKGAAVAGTIDRRIVSAAVSVQDKVYDGTTVADGTIGSLTNVIAGDDLVLDASHGALRFLDRNAGAGKAVVLSGLTLGGTDAGDYSLSDLGAGSATIAKARLTLTASADRKEYDGNRNSTKTVAIDGLIQGDSATATQAFDTKNAGGRILSADSWTIADGNDGGNYAIVKVDAEGTIDRKQLSGALTGLVSKVYDGTDTAMIAPINIAGLVAGDAVTLVTDGAHFADRNVGTGKTVTVRGMTLSGDDAANYLLGSDHASADIGTITARTVSVGVTGHGAKTYDGTTRLSHAQLGGLSFVAADGDAATAALMAADGVAFDTNGVTGVLVDRNAGTGKSVTLGGYTLTGNGLGNYVLASDTLLGVVDVARAVLDITAGTDTKAYDGTVNSTAAARITGLMTGDSASATQAFDNRNAGARLLTVTGYTLADGNDGGNYMVRLTDTAGTIAQRALAIRIADASKTAGQADPAFGYALTSGDLLSGDQIQGAPVREAGEQAGVYAIRQGSLAVSDNYALTVTDGRLTIAATTNGSGNGSGGSTGGGTSGGSGGGTGNGTGGGNGSGTGNGNGGGAGTGTGTGNGGGTGTGTAITPSVVQQAVTVATRAVIALPGTTETRNLPHQATGSFDAYPGFGWVGKDMLSGNRTVAMRFAIEGIDVGQSSGTRPDAIGGEIERRKEAIKDLCQAGSRYVSACGSAADDRLPYVANQTVSTTIRFEAR